MHVVEHELVALGALDLDLIEQERAHVLGNEAAAGHLPHPAGHGGLKGLGLICKVNVDVVQLEHVHAALGQARHIGRGSMAVGRLDILKAE